MSLAMRVKHVLSLVVFVFVICLSTLAQTETATLSGVVQDPKGDVVPDVEVTATRIETEKSITTKTNGAGIYVFAGLMQGRYHLALRKPGFKEIAIKAFELHTQDKLEQNFALEVGSASETVTVSGTAGMVPISDSPAVGVLVGRDFVENMPLNGRSLQDLIALAPGAVSSAQQNGLFSINGQHDDANYFTVDGLSANNGSAANVSAFGTPGPNLAGVTPSQTALGTTQSLVSVDELEEFKVQTATYTAEFGRQPGGQVALTTRSGSNEMHGSLFEFLRNEALDANSWLFDSNGIAKQPERQNIFGGTVGGPLEIPRIYNGRDKTFFFISYEGTRLILPNFTKINVPTIASRESAAPGVQPFLAAMPVPNGPANADGYTAQFVGGYSDPSSIDSVSVRVDQNLGEKLVIYARYARTASSARIQPNNDPSEQESISPTANTISLGATDKITTNLINDIRFSYSRSGGDDLSKPIPFHGASPYPLGLLVPSQYVPQGATATAQVSINLRADGIDFFQIPGYVDFRSKQQQYNVVDAFSWARGKHLFKFGADYRRLLPVFNQSQYGYNLTLSSLASVQNGIADNAFIVATQEAFPVFNNLSLFAQDHWQLTHKLTVDYGLRWEFNPAPGASNGLYPLAVTSANFATMQLAPAGTPQYRTIYHNFAPRLGFAYQIPGSHSVVIRGGAGIFYDTGQALGATGYGFYPFVAFSSINNLPLPLAPIAPPTFNGPLTPPYGYISGLTDPNLTLPYTEQWSLSVDSALSARNTLTVSYVGNEGHRLLFTNDYIPAAATNFASGFNFNSNAGASNYNALQIQDQGFAAHGLQVVASWTWAHAIDNVSTDTNVNFFPPLRGNSDNDVRQSLNVALNYEIPGGGTSKVAKALTRGWLVASRFTAQTGYPFDVFQGYYNPTDAFNGFSIPIRVDRVQGVPLYLHNAPGAPGDWQLNPLAFGQVPTDPVTGAPLHQGSLGRNFIHGPNFWNVNFSVQREFPIHDELHLQFRVDAFNALNHPNFGFTGEYFCGCSDPGFGQLPSQFTGNSNPLYTTGAARSLQVSLRLHF